MGKTKTINWSMKYNFYFCLRVHCFNYYGKNKDKKCPDLELRYYIECHKKLNDSRRRRSPIVCQAEVPKSTTDSAPTTTDSPEVTTEATKAATTNVNTTAGATTEDDTTAEATTEPEASTPPISIWRTPPERIEGECFYDFPSPRRVFEHGYSIDGLEDLTVHNCIDICNDVGLDLTFSSKKRVSICS